MYFSDFVTNNSVESRIGKYWFSWHGCGFVRTNIALFRNFLRLSVIKLDRQNSLD